MTAYTLFTLQNASLVYRALPALTAIDWRVDSDQQWACLGPNGAGKTSLARVLSGQASHYSGEFDRSPQLQSEGVAYVCFEQQKALCDRDKKLDDSDQREDASDPGTLVARAILGHQPACDEYRHWVKRLGMEHILNRGLRFISPGEMRKTLLVKAILSKPALLILDSPLDGLDKTSQVEMQHILEELISSEQRLLLLCRQAEDIPAGVSHVLVLDQGSTFCSGPRSDVLSDDKVRALMNPPITPFAELPLALARPYEIDRQQPLLALAGVSVAYGDNLVLDNISWQFRTGQHCLVSGPNGCGKSTLLSLITGDNHKAYGQNITLFGLLRGSGESIWDIKQKYGQLDTALHLNWVRGMKVIEVALSGFFDTVGLYDNWGDQQRNLAQGWLSALGLGALASESFDGLSFGIQRMVLLARAMVKSPAILLLDEPSLGLDGHHRRLLLDAIDHIAQQSDTQIIFVSHSVGEVPQCINQHLEFVPGSGSFELVCHNS
jgi:molybdate transport system ATP-binding protein